MQDSVMATLPRYQMTEELMDGSNLTPGQRMFTEALAELSLMKEHVGMGLVGLMDTVRDNSIAHVPLREVRGAVVQICEVDDQVYPIGFFSRSRNMSLVGGANRDRTTRCRLDAPPLRHHPTGLKLLQTGAVKMPVSGPLFVRLNEPYIELRTELLSASSELVFATVARFQRADVAAGAVTFPFVNKDVLGSLEPNQNRSLSDMVQRHTVIANVGAPILHWAAQPVPEGPAYQLMSSSSDNYVFFNNTRLTHVFGSLLLHLVRQMKDPDLVFMFDPRAPYPRVRISYPIDPAMAAFDPGATLSQQSRRLLDVFLTEGLKNDDGVTGHAEMLAPSGKLVKVIRNHDGSKTLLFDVGEAEPEQVICPEQFVLGKNVVAGTVFQDGDSLGAFDFSEATITADGHTHVQSARLPLRVQQLCMGQMLQHLSVYPGEMSWPEDADSCLFDPQLIYWSQRATPGYVDTRHLPRESWDETMGGYVSPLFTESVHPFVQWGNMRVDLPQAGHSRPTFQKRRRRTASV